MFHRAQTIYNSYPRQFWLMFTGMLISTIGSSMIWPFLMIYVTGKLGLPLSQVAWLIPISAVVGIGASFIAGPITDRIGRKWVMIISLVMNGVGYLLMSHAATLGAFAAIQALNGFFNPLYRVGGDAMMADLVPPEQRPDAYALLRMSNNLGISIGPAIGGFIASTSYTIAFYSAAAGLASYGLLLAVFAQETLPSKTGSLKQVVEALAGYRKVLSDNIFVPVVLAFALNQVCAVLIWVLMGVYAKQNYGVSERLYGLIPTTNAIMVVAFQVLITKLTKRYPPLAVMAAGALFYALGTGSVALAHGFSGFWISMVIMTIGELIIVPTSSTYVANRAPADMRGRYMSVFSMTWGLSSIFAPILGGYVGDFLGQTSIWYSGLAIGLLSTIGFLLLARRSSQLAQPVTTSS